MLESDTIEHVVSITKLSITMLALMFTTLLIMNILDELGLFKRLTSIFRAIRKLVNVDERFLLCLTLCLVSPTVSYTMILKIKEETKLTDEQVFPILLLTSPIVHLRDAVQFLLPLAISTLGIYAGTVLAGISIGRALMRLLIHVLYARHLLKCVNVKLDTVELVESERTKITEGGHSYVVRSALCRTWRLFKKVSIRLLIATVVLVVLTMFRVFDIIGAALRPALATLGFNEYMVTIVITQLACILMALVVAGNFYMSGMLTLDQVIIAILVGQIIVMPIAHFRNFFPVRASLFGARLALRWSLFDIFTSEITTLIFLTFFLLL